MSEVDWFHIDDEDFLRELASASFEELRDESQTVIDRLASREFGLDELSIVVRRVRAMLDDCDRRIKAVEFEIAELDSSGSEPSR
ncbi:hypothetical protein [Ferrimicrobium acidiphilum]|uniref:Uncharacterized protein n=1 Tax=Ferrimicrobium acidiphilum DSM 19497 TaxID=1121877 RepID=A0A0D8FS95_9ACTN|nr:hypothetical protein [Ferrimicrobium acidiphilum]KJE76140.1 hypothetical protein FEAC_21220 [Ferrimicrobium acidiphilum DSM 19497]MCL5053141.1 hypothetical protein [Gammaproteobacteria bacterium]